MIRSLSPQRTKLPGALLFGAAMLPLLTIGCGSSPSEPYGLTPSRAIDACTRHDVQDVVGKEIRSKLLKAALPRLFTAAAFGIVNLDQIEREFHEARVSFQDVVVDGSATAASGPYSRIICTARIQLDMSNATDGQQIMGIERLRWVINFARPFDDPATGGFTVDVDTMSIGRGVTINGEPLQTEQEQPSADDGAAAGMSEGEEAAAQEPGGQGSGEITDTPGQSEDINARAVSSPDASAQAAPGNPATAGSTKPANDEDLYAPHH